MRQNSTRWFWLLIFILPVSLFAQGPDCSEALVVCSSTSINFNPSGPGNSDFSGGSNNDGCLSGEHQSAWFYFQFRMDMPPNSVIDFTIDPDAGAGQDYDFAVFGPNVDCSNLGSPTRCSFAAGSCGFCPQTGLGNGASDVSEGAGGDGYVASLTVQPGQGFFLLIDNWLSSSTGFDLNWSGSAAPFLDCTANPNCELGVDAGPAQTICAGAVPFQLQGVALGATPSATYTWTGTGNSANFLSNPFIPQPFVFLPPNFSGPITYTLTVQDGSCTQTATVNINVATGPPVNITGNLNICPGQSTVLTASGAGITGYSWSTGTGGPTTVVSAPGPVSVTVTNASGCQTVSTVNVNQAPTPSPLVTGDQVVCVGGNATLNAGTGFTSYQWSNAMSGQVITVHTPGTYTVTVTNAAGCTGTGQITVFPLPGPTVNITGGPNVCIGNTAVLNAGGGFSGYQWSNNAVTQTTTISTPGTYSVTVVDNEGCQGTGSITIFSAPSPTPTITGNLNICPGTSTTLSAGGSGFTSYQWSTNASGPSITVANPGNIGLTVTNADGCTGTANVTVNAIPSPNPVISGDLTICAGQLTALSAGAGYSSYTWSNASHNPAIATDQPGTYSVTVTNAQGCSGSASVLVEQLPSPTPTINGDITLCPSQSSTLSVPGTYTSYSWSTSGTGSSISVNNIGTYSVTVQNADGCTGSASVNVTSAPVPTPSISGATSFCPGGSTTLNAGAGYSSYLWSTSANTAQVTVNSAGTYSVTVTNNQGCTGTASVPVSLYSVPAPTISGALSYCAGASTTLDAGSGYASYSWTGGGTGQTLSVSAPGDYSVTVTNVNGCTGNKTVTVAENANPTPSITGDLNFCQGQNTTLSATPGFAGYLWSNMASTGSTTVSSAGNYSVTVTDANGCQGNATTSVTVLPNPVPSITGNLQICPTGDATQLSVAGSYSTYNWTGGSSNPTLNVTSSGAYSVTVTDVNGCQGTASTNVSNFPAPMPTITGDFSICSGDSSVFSLSQPYSSYQWSSGQSTPSITVSSTGNTIVTVTDANGCTGTASAALTVNPLPTVNITGNAAFCPGTSASLNAGSGFSNYSWSTNQTSSTISVNTGGTYSVTVTDANGCVNSDDFSVTANPAPTVQISGNLTFCTNGATSLSATPGLTTYQWSTGANTPNVTITQPGNIGLTVTDANGCTASTSVNVQQLTQLMPNITGTLSICPGQNTVLTADAGYSTYAWSTGGNTAQINTSTAGPVSVTVTDSYGCSGSTSVTINQYTPPAPQITGTTSFCTGTSTQLNTGNYNAYLWSTGDSTSMVSITAPGLVSVTVTDNHGCTGTANTNVTALALPTPAISGPLNFCPGTSTTLSTMNPYSAYAWSGGSSSASVVITTPGAISVTVTDNNGCQGSTNATINNFAVTQPTINGALQYCPGASTQLSVAQSFATYNWSSGANTSNIQVTNPGNYGVTVTDNNGCVTNNTVNTSLFVVTPPNIAGPASFCNGETVTLDAGAGYQTYTWSTGAGSSTIDITNGGDFGVSVVDVNGCSSMDEVTVIRHSLPQVTIGGSSTFCVGNSTTLNAGGQYASYSWSNETNGSTVVITTPGIVGLTVTDNNGCMGSASVNVIEATELSPVITGPLAYCTNGNTTLDAGSGFATYQWSNNANTPTITVNAPGMYSVSVTDAGGCAGSTSVQVIENPLPTPAIAGVPSYCAGTSTTLNAGAGYNLYQWSTGAPSQQITVSQPGNIAVTVTDVNGCKGSTAVTVVENPLPVFSITGNNYYCSGSATTLNATTGFANYAWSTGGGNTPTINVSSAGQVGLTVTNSFGCTSNQAVQINQISLPVADAGPDGVLDCNHSSVTLGGTGSSQGNQYQYTWSGPGINPSNLHLPNPVVFTAGNYSLTILDLDHQCQSIGSNMDIQDLTQEPAAVVTVNGGLTCISNNALVSGNGSATGPTIQYQWYDALGNVIPGANGLSYSANTAQVYTLVVTDQNTGCSNAASGTVLEDRVLPTAEAGLPQLLNCYQPVGTVNGTGSSTGANFTYTWSALSGQISGPVNNITANVTQPGNYQLVVLNTQNGCQSQDVVNVTQDIVPPVANAGSDQELNCVVPSVELNGSLSSEGPQFTYEWRSNNTVVGQSNFLPTAQAGTYTLVVTNTTNGCTASDVTVVNLNNNQPTDLLLAVDNPICFGDDNGSILVEQVVGGQSPYLFSLNGAALQSAGAFLQLTAGSYSVMVQDAIGCEFETQLIIQDGNDLNLELGDDQFIKLGDDADLHALINIDADQIAQFNWGTNELLNCMDCVDQEVHPLKTTTFTASLVDVNGCAISDRVTVFVDRTKTIYVPSAFSPNGDGTNDVLMIFADKNVSNVKSFQIFNRWGESVFEVYNFPPNDPTYGWDGHYRSNLYNAAVFAWFAEVEFIDGETVLFKGDFSLMR